MTAEQGVALTLARFRAKQIVKDRWLAKGRRLTEVLPRDVIGWAEDTSPIIRRCSMRPWRQFGRAQSFSGLCAAGSASPRLNRSERGCINKPSRISTISPQ